MRDPLPWQSVGAKSASNRKWKCPTFSRTSTSKMVKPQTRAGFFTKGPNKQEPVSMHLGLPIDQHHWHTHHHAPPLDADGPHTLSSISQTVGILCFVRVRLAQMYSCMMVCILHLALINGRHETRSIFLCKSFDGRTCTFCRSRMSCLVSNCVRPKPLKHKF